MQLEGSTAASLPAQRSYFSLIRRLSLLRQVAEYRAERNWDSPGALLERTRRFFQSRGTVPYHFHAPVPLSKYTQSRLTSANVFFGPPGSDQIVIFARRESDARYVLIHAVEGESTEHDVFPLDKRFGSLREAHVVSLFGWKTRAGSFDQYITPVDFGSDFNTGSGRIVVRVNVMLSEGPGHEMPAQLIGERVDGEYVWKVSRLGNAHDWYPDTNSSLFLPAYEPHEVVYGVNNDTFICTGRRKIGSDDQAWAIWNDNWSADDPKPLIEDLPPGSVSTLAVSTLSDGTAMYSCALAKLRPGHPLSEHTPSLAVARGRNQFCMIPLEGIADIGNVLSIHVAGSRSGIFHCTTQGPTAQIVVHQNGVPVGSPLEDMHLHGFTAEEVNEEQPSIRIRMVVSDPDGRGISLLTATSTAWPETLAMMGVHANELNGQIAVQEATLKEYQREQSGRSVTALGLGSAHRELQKDTVHGWWRYISGRIARASGAQPAPYISRAQAEVLIRESNTNGKLPSVDPLTSPLADLFGIDAHVAGDRSAREEAERLCRDVRTYMEDRGLIVSAHDAGVSRNGASGAALLILHPNAGDWVATAEPPDRPSAS